ncbi:type II toxin-antitoxin system YafO family toxin [Alysiella filiformis]|nr:type II toxin-antitoxin system YafO family toxin [Alysiella filiformis]UBQ55455.1 type II toxin-antitoxin system YafO family toxin [Alysiella filiformis DSM 16848]
MMILRVDITANLRTSLRHADVFISEFRQWKSTGETGENDFYLFGKDGAYTTPQVNGEPYVLRHVHLLPLTDTTQLAKWQRNWQTGARRTSNRALVYVQDGNRFLLIDILNEPFAHEIAQMKTEQHRLIMRNFAKIAEQYIYHHEIIA